MEIILFGQHEKRIQSNLGGFKSSNINQSESRITYKDVIFFDIYQSESSITYMEIVIFFDINKSESSFIHNKFLCFWYQTIRIERSFTVIFVVVTNQNEVFKDSKFFIDQNKSMFMKFSNQSKLLTFFDITNI